MNLIRCLLLLLLTGLGPRVVFAAESGTRVERVSFTPRSDGQGYVIRVHATARIQAFSEPTRVREDQVKVILFNADLSGSYRHDPAQGPVSRYEVRREKGHVVLVFYLADPSVHLDAYRDRNSPDLLLTITAPAATAAQVTSGPEQGARERWRLDTIVIDAGHGGKDPGTVGSGRVREKDVVLPVALLLGKYLEDLPGVRVVYTRKDDRFLELKDRGHLANEAGGKLFISIHANAAGNRSATGTETFFLGMHKTEAARKAMERENSVVQYESDQDHYKTFDDSALIRRQLAQSAYMRQSEQLAGLVEQQFAERVGRRSRGVKQAGFWVLWGASMPAILVELGFITNPGEAAFLTTEAGQAYMASAIFRAVRDFKDHYEKGLNLVASE